MTREEAINKWIIPAIYNSWNNGTKCEEIIKALEQEPCGMTAEEYRQRMMQAFHNADCGGLIAVCVLPTEKEFEHLEWLLKNHYKREPCEDAISRQAAIVALDDRMSSLKNVDMQIAMGFAKGIIHELTPVTPQPKMGKWLIKKVGDYDHAICSVCGDDSFLSPEWDALELYKHCPNCGSKMMQEANDEYNRIC